MKNKNTMMDFIWLLNAASNSAFETRELYGEFLRQKEDFINVRRNTEGDTSRGEYLRQELRRNLESLEDLRKIIEEAGDVLAVWTEGKRDDR